MCCSEVVEHVNNQSTFVKKLSEAVKPGGFLFMSTISRTYLSYFMTIIMAENVTGLVQKGTHDWNLYLTYDEL